MENIWTEKYGGFDEYLFASPTSWKGTKLPHLIVLLCSVHTRASFKSENGAGDLWNWFLCDQSQLNSKSSWKLLSHIIRCKVNRYYFAVGNSTIHVLWAW